MPDLLTPQALATAGPLVLETFFKHFLGPKSGKGASEAREDLMYDEAFVLMKTFLEIATKYPVAALQRFGLVRTPAPPWVALHRVLIPQSTLGSAADYLVTALGGEDMAYKVAGGSKWWQVRAGPGVEAEWIVMKKDWKEMSGGRASKGTSTPKNSPTPKKASREQKEKERAQKRQEMEDGDPEEGLVGEDGGVGENGEFRKEMDEMRCMLYIHGGAYYWGSINTHRYTIWRYARKMHGRCFAVNYRKAPQYPFPCAIQDCLAAWLYLVNPPPDARHRPVDPKNIILAGDSAGGGLVWALLQILRDTPGLDLPAGAVLISPWSDLTHSFPSILGNTATDIVPPYGFIHKPSSLWPPPPPDLTNEIQSGLRTRVKDAVSRLKGDHHLHHHLPERYRPPDDVPLVHKPAKAVDLRSSSPNNADGKPASRMAGEGSSAMYPMSERNDGDYHPEPTGESTIPPHRANPGLAIYSLEQRQMADLAEAQETQDVRKTTLTLCDAPLRLEVKDQTVDLDTQIQLYATNAQLCHPWVSPALGYLGGLPPLLIIAGDKEVLRDEIIYAAHKAAHPDQYPVRDDVRAQLPSLQGIEEKYGPTNVHLQVYDGACHDLPLFSMTKVSRGLFRAIASFARYVTPSAPGSLSISKSQFASPSGTGSRTPVHVREEGVVDQDLRESSEMSDARPVLGQPIASTPPFMTPVSSMADLTPGKLDMSALSVNDTRSLSIRRVESPQPLTTINDAKDGPALDRDILARTSVATTYSQTSSSDTHDRSHIPDPTGRATGSVGPGEDVAGPRFGEDPADQDSRAAPGTAGHSGIYRGQNPFTDHMIRERVATDGTCRPLEPAAELDAIKMPKDEVGMIKEGPALRYLNGQSLWDKKYKHAIRTVEKHRRKNLKIAHERDSGKIRDMWTEKVKRETEQKRRQAADGEMQEAGHAVGMDAPRETDAEASGWETEHATEDEEALRPSPREKTKGRNRSASAAKEKHKSVEEVLLDQSWSWSWALDGEAPPPSAIVSRRDFGEARQLALMADRMDSDNDTHVNGLSIWVGLAAFFSTSTDRNKAHDVLKRAHEVKKAEKAGRGTLPGESAPGKAMVEKGEKAVGKMGRLFKLGRN